MSGEPATIPPGANYEFNVADPQKKEKGGALDMSYWVYQIYTKTSLVGPGLYKQPSMRAMRRYNDFVWLREQLVEEYPGVICPPIPEKSIRGALEKVTGNGPSPLREYRQRAMRKFLVRVGAHPILYRAEPFMNFLQLDESEFAKLPKSGKKKVDVELTGSEKMAQMKSSVFGGAKAKHEEDSMLEDTRQYITQLENSLIMLRDRIELLVKRRRETSGSLGEFGKAFARVGEIEQSQEDGPLSHALIDVGHHSEHLAKVYQEQADNETIQVVETIGYYIGICSAIRDVIKRLAKMTSVRDTLENVVNSLTEDRTAAQSAGKENKVRSLDAEIQSTTAKRDEAKRQLDSAQATFNEELRRFHREKQYDIKQMLKSFVELQLEYANKMKKSWETLLPSVEAIKVD